MIPNLLHPVPVTIQSLSVLNTTYDEHAREPVQQVAHASAEIVQGQVNWAIDKDLRMTHGGAQEGASGYVLFRLVDLAAAGISLKQNDRFTKIGLELTDVYITSLKHTGHYVYAGGATMVKAYFTDRAPSRQRSGIARPATGFGHAAFGRYPFGHPVS